MEDATGVNVNFYCCPDTDQDEVIKRTIVATYSGHKYFQTSFDIPTGLQLTHKLLFTLFRNLIWHLDDYTWCRNEEKMVNSVANLNIDVSNLFVNIMDILIADITHELVNDGQPTYKFLNKSENIGLLWHNNDTNANVDVDYR